MTTDPPPQKKLLVFASMEGIFVGAGARAARPAEAEAGARAARRTDRALALALEAVTRLEALDCPLVLVSARPRIEALATRALLGHHGIFIAEGATVFVPTGAAGGSADQRERARIVDEVETADLGEAVSMTATLIAHGRPGVGFTTVGLAACSEHDALLGAVEIPVVVRMKAGARPRADPPTRALETFAPGARGFVEAIEHLLERELFLGDSAGHEGACAQHGSPLRAR